MKYAAAKDKNTRTATTAAGTDAAEESGDLTMRILTQVSQCDPLFGCSKHKALRWVQINGPHIPSFWVKTLVQSQIAYAL